MSDYDIDYKLPPLLRERGFTEDEIERAIALMHKFRKEHRDAVIR